MTIERAIRLAAKWSQGFVCSISEGEAKEYHKMCLEALRAQQEPEKNDPLTAEELRNMDGCPVWCVDKSGRQQLSIVCACLFEETNEMVFSCSNRFGNDYDWDVYGMDNEKGWLAYRQPPKDGD